MSFQFVIDRPDTATVEAEGNALVQTARSLTVASKAEDATAKQFLSRIGAMKAQVEKLFEAPKAAAFAAHKAIVAAEKTLLTPLDTARADVQRKCLVYQAAEEQRAAEERLRLEAEARKIEEDRRRQELAAIEAQRQAENDRRAKEAAAAAAARKAEEDRQMVLAAEAEKAGQAARAAEIMAQAERQSAERARQEAAARAASEAEEARLRAEAAAIAAEPIEVPVVHVESQTAAVEGVSSRSTWRAEVTDLQALIGYVATRPEWAHLLEPAMPALNALARSQRGMLRIPGVSAVEEKSMSVRRTG